MSKRHLRRVSPVGTSSFLLFVSAVQLLAVPVASAYPGDVFVNGAPVRAPDGAPDPTKKAQAGHSVNESGAVTYSIPLPVAPNRQNLTPDLALQYSSRSPLRGGIAAGWTLGLPVIERDTSRGVLRHADYRSSLSKGNLVRVGPPDEPVHGIFHVQEYRAEEDSTHVKYERYYTSLGTAYWRAYTTDGRIYELGTTAASKDVPGPATSTGAVDNRYFVTRIVDRFGNEIQFNYGRAYANVAAGLPTEAVDIRIESIEYGKNAAAGLGHHSRLVFEYSELLDQCPDTNVPIGAQFDYRSGFPLYKGASRLNRVRLDVVNGAAWTERRAVALAYDMTELTCDLAGKAHSPLRFLNTVTESAVAPDGTVNIMPAISFTYGKRERTFDEPTPEDVTPNFGKGQTPLSYNKAGGWPVIESMLLDLDGDAKLDRLTSFTPALPPFVPGGPPMHPYYCQARWERRNSAGYDPSTLFGATLPDPDLVGVGVPNAFPVMPWADDVRNDGSADRDDREYCSLAAQFSRETTNVPAGETCGAAASYLSYRFMDMDADGLPDLVTAIDTNRGRYRPEDDARVQPQTNFCLEAGACRDGDNSPTLCKVVSSSPGYLYKAVGQGSPNGDAVCPDGQGCWKPGCGGDWNACCSDLGCEGSSEIGNNWAPPVDNLPTNSPGWDGTGDSELDRVHNGVGGVNGEVGREGIHPAVGDPKCMQWPEIYCGRYVLRVYKNVGGGQFSSAPQLMLSPVPLETDRPTSQLGAGPLAAASSWHGFADLDGDGVLDAIHMEPFFWGSTDDYISAPTHFSVFPGTGAGSFVSHPLGGGYAWSSPRVWTGTANDGTPGMARARVSLRVVDGVSVVHRSYDAVAMHDLNGDGLADYVDTRNWVGQTPMQEIRVFFNTGRGFQSNATWPSYVGTVFGPAWQNKVARFDRSMDWAGHSYSNGMNRRGYSRQTHRLVDVDADGLVDLVVLPEVLSYSTNPWQGGGNNPVKIYLNVGDRFVYAGSNPTWNKVWTALGRVTLNEQGTWRVSSDFVDLDGDGLAEAITNDGDNAYCTFDQSGGFWPNHCGSSFNGWTDSAASGPMRLLTQVNNGAGGTVSFTYAPVQSTSGRVPHPVWVATAMTANSGTDATGAATASPVTTYAYDQPAYNQDFNGLWGFRGFGKTTSTSPSGSKVVSTRSFNGYYGGLVTDVRTMEASGHVASIEQNTWEQRSVFDTDVHPGTVKTQHLIQRDTRTCGATQTESQCAAQGALRRDTYSLLALSTATDPTPLGYYPYQVLSGAGSGPLPGSVFSASWHQLYIAPEKYWIIPLSDWSGEYVAWGVAGPMTQTSHYHDASKRVELWTSRYVGPGQPWAVTSHEYDMDTGNKTIERSPNHFGTNKGVGFAYDAQRRFVTQTTNEKGHVATTVTDPATGAVLEERGPNVKNGVLDGVIRTVDGFGRVRTESRMIDDPTSGYVPIQVLDVTYLDQVGVGSPHVKVTTRRRIELDQDRWTHEEKEADGFGREIATSAFDDPTLVSRTSMFRDAAGNVVRLRVPHPEALLATDTVDWTFGFDSLGRPLGAAEPARADCTEYGPSALTWCGQRTSYDGWITLREDVAGTLAGDARGTLGGTRVTVNALGQAVLVEELTSPGTWAATTYGYDGLGKVDSILNADGVQTTMTHDLLGRRTVVVRGGRTWLYEYDPNGNTKKIQAPVPAGEVPAEYAVSFSYDDLDRELTRTAGSGDMASADLPVLGTGSTKKLYDQNPNGKGRLSLVEWSHGTSAYEYDSRGNVASSTDTFSILGGTFSDTRTKQVSYNALGQPSTGVAGDGSSFDYGYDNRGLPSTLSWSGDSTFPVMQLSHSVAGNVLERWRPSASGIRVHGATGYDSVGRRAQVWVGSRLPGAAGVTTRASETFFFDGSGEAYRMDTTLASTSAGSSHSAAFTYDAQHHLVSATGPEGYTGAFTHSPGGRIQSAAVAADATAARVHARSVTYTYGAQVPGSNADPDAPVALVSPGGSVWMALDYDAAGNVLTRDMGPQPPFEHVYDGGNRQRAVTAPDGSHDLYWYDGAGRRSLVATTSPGGVVEQVRWNLGDTEVRYDAGGSPESKFAYATLENQSVRIVDAGEVEHLFNDARGHLIAAVDDDGTLRGGFRYGPYGELLNEIGTASGDLLRRFNDKEYDDTSGLSYYGHRYFDERSLTWTQADPLYRFAPDKNIFEPRRTNLYAFTLGNPVRLNDPDGQDVKVSWTAIGFFPWHVDSGVGGIAPLPNSRVSLLHAKATIVVQVGDGKGGLRPVNVTMHSMLYKQDDEVWHEDTTSTHAPRYGAATMEGTLFGGPVRLTVAGSTIVDLKGSEWSLSVGGSGKEGLSGTFGYTYVFSPAQLVTGSGRTERSIASPRAVLVTRDEARCMADPSSCSTAADTPSDTNSGEGSDDVDDGSTAPSPYPDDCVPCTDE